MTELPAYYLPLGRTGDHEHFMPTEHTVSVWGDDLQHGGPPIGLLARSLLRHQPDPAHAFTRVTVDILGAIGMAENRIHTTVLRPGKQISLVQSELSVRQVDGTYRTAARAQGWRMATAETSEVVHLPTPPLTPAPDEIEAAPGMTGIGPLVGEWATKGFVGTLDCRIASSDPEVGREVWVRPNFPLVAGEQTTDIEKFFTVLDIANGIGSTLAFSEWTFMNTDTTVHLHRQPVGEWTGIKARMTVGPQGYGLTGAELFDGSGAVGRSAQTLLIRSVG
ncbi:thioesterase family protein [Nocardia sp. 348MFTsu5.1]|uniref:thioesterase family protein n=1 Tax=Nocardia sp. 348MFTsu5.1 TaxID=1172185 RepID=UPI001E5BD812|nr:thioesterase family protein [Nocardia sp. 348MFTsu5.1]